MPTFKHPSPLIAPAHQLRVPVGLPVQFFPGGDLSETPIAAVVTESSAGGMCKLNFLHAGGGESRASYRYVRHVHDEWLQDPENAARLRQPLHGAPQGAWGFIPGMVFDRQQLVAPVEAEAELAPPAPPMPSAPVKTTQSAPSDPLLNATLG